MQTLLRLGKEMEYPGRFLILGNDGENFITTYGVTARNASSRAKRYTFNAEKTEIRVEATDFSIMSQGNLDLLDYTSVRIIDSEWIRLVAGNGNQVRRISNFHLASAEAILDENLKRETFEPDKYHTPRITGCTAKNPNGITQALHIARDDGKGNTLRNCFVLHTNSPGSYFISTYSGPNIRPTPSFTGSPITLEILRGTAQEITEKIYEAFAPQRDQEDLRVAVMTTVLSKRAHCVSTSIKNTTE